MSLQANKGSASTTTSEYWERERESSGSSSDEGSTSSEREPPVNRPAYLIPRGTSPVSTEVHIALFPWFLAAPSRHPVALDTVSPTLRGSAVRSITDLFVCHPCACDACPKPAFWHPHLPDSIFTVLLECPHFHHVAADYPERYPGPEVLSMRNRAIDRLLPYKSPVPQGTVVVVKHQVQPKSALNIDRVIEDITQSELSVVSLIVHRWASNLPRDPANVHLFQDPRTRGPCAVPPFDRDGSREAAEDRAAADAAAASELALLDSFAELDVSSLAAENDSSSSS
ncbi:hypothetical protein C8F01DRAFT_1260217 [Mycena amicta]|nr:hypothetical protein C8F01DRAFT_1260217 [Mycena amicta]